MRQTYICIFYISYILYISYTSYMSTICVCVYTHIWGCVFYIHIYVKYASLYMHMYNIIDIWDIYGDI